MNLIKYIFLPNQEEADIMAVWDSFKQENERIIPLGYDYETKSGHFSIAGIKKAESEVQDRWLYLYHNLAIIVIAFKLSTEGTLNDIVESSEQKLSGIGSLLGHASILLNPASDKLAAFTDYYGLEKYECIKLLTGSLNFHIHDAQDFHHLLTYTGKEKTELLLKELPIVTANILEITRLSSFYQDQVHTINHEKAELDAKIGSIMQRQFANIENTEQKLDLLEDMVSCLAEIYRTLSANATVILQDQVALEKDLYITTSQVQKITATNTNFYKEEFLQPVDDLIKDLHNLTKSIQISITNAKTSIDILQAQINLIRSKDNLVIQQQMREVLNQNLSLQQEAVTLQIGAGLIEFIVVMYYSLAIFKTLAPDTVHHIPGAVTFAIFFAFSGITVWLTHHISKKLANKKHGHDK